jgi:hypothetical protein
MLRASPQPNGPVSPRVRELLDRRVRSVEALEVLVLLHSTRGGPLSSTEMRARLRLSAADLDDALETLRRHCLVRRDAATHAFCFTPGSAALRQAVDELALAWDHARVDLMCELAANSVRRVRGHVQTILNSAALGPCHRPAPK